MNQHSENQGANIVADVVNIRDGGAAFIKGHTVEIQDGGAGIIAGQTISIKDGGGGILLADQAELRNSTVVFLATNRVSGEAKILFDLRAALLFGVVVGLVLGLLKRLTR